MEFCRAARLTKVAKKGHYAASTSYKVATRGDDYKMYGPKRYYKLDARHDFANANENKLRLSANYLKEIWPRLCRWIFAGSA